MGRFYSVALPETSISAAADLFELTAASDKPLRIWGWDIHQDTDLGDANEEVLQVELKYGVTAGSGGTAQTEVRMNPHDTAAGFTSTNRTTAHTGGTTLWRAGWNVRIPMVHWFTPESAPVIGADNDPVVLTIPAPADALNISASILVEEVA